MRSTPSLRSFSNVAFETVPVFVWFTMALSRPFKEDRQALPLSTSLSSRRSMVWCPWLCARRWCLQLLSTSDLPRRKPLVRVSFPASLSARSFPFTPACPEQYIHVSFRKWMSNIGTYHAVLASYSNFLLISKLIDSVTMMACVVITVTSWGNPAEGMGDCFHIHCQAVYWDRIDLMDGGRT